MGVGDGSLYERGWVVGPYNPKHRYGDYSLLSDPEASDDFVELAKEELRLRVKDCIPEEVWATVIWIVQHNYRVIDPETDEVRFATLVAWKTPYDLK